MTLIIQKPTGAKLAMAKNYPADDDSRAYIAAVEAADGQSLESGVKMAIDAFVLGCKADGIWPAIKASCILAGARTLTGALVPLVGTAPTNFNFVSGDYNRKTGLVGNGSTKYLDSNRNNNADPQNSKHCSFYYSNIGTTVGVQHLGTAQASGNTMIRGSGANASEAVVAVNSAGVDGIPSSYSTGSAGFASVSRAGSGNFSARINGVTSVVSAASVTPLNQNIFVFRRGADNFYSNARLAFYSIGESLDLALLDARVTDLINAFAAAIP
jgi:hypothetical protein